MTVRLYDTATRRSSSCRRAPGAGRDVRLRPDGLPARPYRQRGAVRHLRCGCATGFASAATTSTLVHNITDVNDKIYEAAPGASAERAREATEWYLEDTARFGLEHARRAAARDGDDPGDRRADRGARRCRPRLRVERGRLLPGRQLRRATARSPGQRPDEVEEQEPSALKEDPRDFALWKATKEGEDTSWESPWGPGRPGWHIECSAMAEKTLGPEFLIHGGGLDLVFPHHENERAQSLAVGRPFAKIWMHNGLLRFVGEKMSKSVGNVATIQEVIAEWGREAALLFLMTGHWRKPLEFSRRGDDRCERAGRDASATRSAARPGAAGDWARFAAVLDDDFNTPAALALLHGWPRGCSIELRRGLDDLRPRRAGRQRRGAGRGDDARAGACRGARGPGLRRGRPPARRDRRGRAGKCATCPTASSSYPCRDARADLRAQCRTGGATRPSRGARALGLRAGCRVARLARRKGRVRASSRSAS